jgi:hypothetical protein
LAAGDLCGDRSFHRSLFLSMCDLISSRMQRCRVGILGRVFPLLGRLTHASLSLWTDCTDRPFVHSPRGRSSNKRHVGHSSNAWTRAPSLQTAWGRFDDGRRWQFHRSSRSVWLCCLPNTGFPAFSVEGLLVALPGPTVVDIVWGGVLVRRARTQHPFLTIPHRCLPPPPP